MEAFPAEEPTRRANALNVLMKMVRAQEEGIADAVKLLRDPAKLDLKTLRKLSAGYI